MTWSNRDVRSMAAALALWGLMGCGTTGPAPKVTPEELETCRRSQQAIHNAVQVYRISNSMPRLPTLAELVAPGPGSGGAAYLETGGAIPKDPWGTAFRLEAGTGTPPLTHVVSAGPDGAFGTEDDLAYPSRRPAIPGDPEEPRTTAEAAPPIAPVPGTRPATGKARGYEEARTGALARAALAWSFLHGTDDAPTWEQLRTEPSLFQGHLAALKWESDTPPLDLWGTGYRIQALPSEGSRPRNTFAATSAGPDRTFGTGDDITRTAGRSR